MAEKPRKNFGNIRGALENPLGGSSKLNPVLVEKQNFFLVYSTNYYSELDPNFQKSHPFISGKFSLVRF